MTGMVIEWQEGPMDYEKGPHRRIRKMRKQKEPTPAQMASAVHTMLVRKEEERARIDREIQGLSLTKKVLLEMNGHQEPAVFATTNCEDTPQIMRVANLVHRLHSRERPIAVKPTRLPPGFEGVREKLRGDMSREEVLVAMAEHLGGFLAVREAALAMIALGLTKTSSLLGANGMVCSYLRNSKRFKRGEGNGVFVLKGKPGRKPGKPGKKLGRAK